MTDGSTTATAHLARAIEAVAEAVTEIVNEIDVMARADSAGTASEAAR